MKPYTIASVTIIILIVSTIKVMCYYLFFNINIFDFIDADEIVLKSVIYLPIIMFYFFLSHIIFQGKKKPINIVRNAEVFENLFLTILFFVCMFTLILLVGTACQKFDGQKLLFSLLLYVMAILLILFSSSYLYIFFKAKTSAKDATSLIFEKQISLSFILIQVLFIFSLYMSMTEITRAKENLLYKNAELTLDKFTIRCSKDTTVIGITKNYIFLFDNKNNKPLVYNKAHVISFSGPFRLNGD